MVLGCCFSLRISLPHASINEFTYSTSLASLSDIGTLPRARHRVSGAGRYRLLILFPEPP